MKVNIKNAIKIAFETNFGEPPTEDSAWSVLGGVTDANLDAPEELKDEQTLGGTVVYYGHFIPKSSISGLVTNTNLNTILNLIPDNQTLQPAFVALKLANSDLSLGFLLAGGIPESIALNLKAGEPAKFDIDLTFLKLTSITPFTPQRDSGTPVMWHNAQVLVGGNNFQVSECKITIRQEVKRESDLSTTKPAGEKRLAHLVAWGRPSVEMDLSIFVPHVTGIGADTLSPITVTVTVGNQTLTFQNLYIDSRRLPFKAGDDLWVQELRLKGFEDSLP
jgi:hypothetical protein